VPTLFHVQEPVLQDLSASDSTQHTPQARTWVLRIGALMMLGAGGAFAVAGLSTLEQPVQIKQLVEAVSTLATDGQIQSLSASDMRMYRSDTSRSNDTADSLLKRLGLSDKAAADFLRSNPLVRENLLGRPGRMLNAEADEDQHLLKLTVRWTTESNAEFQRLVIEKTEQGFSAVRDSAPLKASVRLSGGLIQSSLFAATDDARIPDSIAMQVAEIFAGDIDFHRSLRKGDRFTVSYESLEADGEVLKPGRVLSAEFVNKGKSFQAMWFQEAADKPGGYYSLDGQSLRRVYLASPLAFSRVTSGFKMRFHPILQEWRAHLGVDYAAPQGTPVRNVGMGVVESAGNKGGYGNAVVVKHNNGHSTVYAHLSKVLVKRGQSVAQGQTIGLVGATGWATGPHLHFEFRVNGRHQDPMQLARQSETIPVPAHARERFNLQAKEVAQQLTASAVAFANTNP
jgi:murein DD-endopeptidase MepM/ murein hydrolase activator NlpD